MACPLSRKKVFFLFWAEGCVKPPGHVINVLINMQENPNPPEGPSEEPRQTIHKPRQKRGLIKFEAILDATKILMIESGSVGLRIQDISERSGVSIGGIYQYFPSKEAIVNEIADRYFDWVGAIIFEPLGHPPPTPTEFEHLFRAVFDHYAQAHLDDAHSLGIFLCISSDQKLMDRSRQAAFKHATRVAEMTQDVFPGWNHDDYVRSLYLAMVMARPVVEAALAAPEQERRPLLETGFEIIISRFRTG